MADASSMSFIPSLEKRAIRFTDGTHIVGLYTHEDRLLSSVIPFFAEGLRTNNRCFYAASPRTVGLVKKHLHEAGIDVDEALAREQLVVVSDKDLLLDGKKFNPEFLVELYRADIERAIIEGWKHVRATAEMSWLIENVDGRDAILYYEALSTKLFNNTDKVHALCQYNTARMSGLEIIELLKIHPWALIDDRIGKNPFWIDPSPDDYQTSN